MILLGFQLSTIGILTINIFNGKVHGNSPAKMLIFLLPICLLERVSPLPRLHRSLIRGTKVKPVNGAWAGGLASKQHWF